MSLAQILPSRSFSPFRFNSKKASPDPIKKFDLIARSFDESLLRRLDSLAPDSNPPSICLSWLSLAIDFLSSVHAEAQALISGVNESPPDVSLSRHLDESVKLLDICNSISSEIERLRQRRLLTNFTLHLIDASGKDPKPPAPEKIRRAGECLADLDHRPSRPSNPSSQTSIDALIRDLAAGLGRAPRGKISSAGKLVRRTFYAVGLVTVLVFGAFSSSMFGSEGPVSVRAPAEFLWADSFNALESAVHGELNRRRLGSGGGPVLREIADADSRVRKLRDVIDDAAGDKGEDALFNAVREVGAAMGPFSEGLDRLCNGVNGMFQTVLCNRNGVLGEFCRCREATIDSDVRCESKFMTKSIVK